MTKRTNLPLDARLATTPPPRVSNSVRYILVQTCGQTLEGRPLPLSPASDAALFALRQEVLQNCIHELVAEASHAGGSHFASEESRISSRVSRPRVRGAVPVILRAMGLLEWSGQQRPCASMAYQWAARTAIGLIVAASIWLTLGDSGEVR